MKIENGRTLYNSRFVPVNFVIWVYDTKDMLVESFSVRGIVLRHVSYWKLEGGHKKHLRDMARLEEVVIVTDAAGDDDVNIVELGYEFDSQESMETALAQALKQTYDEAVSVVVKDFTKEYC